MSLVTPVPNVEAEQAAHTAVARAKVLAADFATRAASHDVEASFPFENFDALHATGLLNLTVPRDSGGAGARLPEVCKVIETIARGDPSTALVLTMHYLQHAGLARNKTWPAEVRSMVVRESLSSIALLNAARVEPELGTPARGGLPATTATRTGSGWKVSGRKIYTTGAPILRWATVWAKTDEEAPRVGAFLVPLSAAGVSIEKTWNHLGMRATGSDDLILDNVEIPPEHAVDVRAPGDWTGGDPQAGAGSLVTSALYNGIALAARNWLVEFLDTRTPSNLGATLSTLPRFQVAAGEIESLLMVNDRLLYNLAEDLESGRRVPAPPESSLVKVVVTANVVRAIKLALDLTGNHGLSRDNPLERHYRDAMCGPIHTPQDDMALAGAGRWSFSQFASKAHG